MKRVTIADRLHGRKGVYARMLLAVLSTGMLLWGAWALWSPRPGLAIASRTSASPALAPALSEDEPTDGRNAVQVRPSTKPGAGERRHEVQVTFGFRGHSPLVWPAAAPAPPCPVAAGELAGTDDSTDDRQSDANVAEAQSLAQLSSTTLEALLSSDNVAVRAAGLRLSRQWETLVVEALATSDPRAHLLAVQGCGVAMSSGEGVPAQCAQLTALRLALLDPNNADAWVQAAGEAQRAGDASGVVNALFRASQANHSTVYFNMLPALTQAGWTGGQSVVQRQMELMLASAEGDADLVGHMQTMLGLCGAEPMADANRSQVCERIAGTMLHAGSSALEAMVALSIGQRAGWDDAAVRGARDAIRSVLAAASDPGDEADLCRFHRAALSRVMLTAQRSEWVALERAGPSAGRTSR